jgi:hypothetical protein
MSDLHRAIRAGRRPRAKLILGDRIDLSPSHAEHSHVEHLFAMRLSLALGAIEKA